MKLHGALAWAALGLLAGCRREKQEAPHASATVSASASAMPNANANASAMPNANASATARADGGVHREDVVVDPDEEILRRSILKELVPQRGPGSRVGVFDAVLEAAGGRREAVAEPAPAAAPTAYRAPLAFYRLARELGMRVVPVTVLRAIPLGEIGGALDARGGGPAALRALRVQNDGTVDVLLATRASASAGSPWEAPRGGLVAVDDGPQVTVWDLWASAEAPRPGEDGSLLRDYVEMRVLDYLAANLGRRAAHRSGRALVLADNAGAFAPHPDGPTVDAMLRRLRGFHRFPRGLREALARLDRARTAALFEAGAFEAWLLPPRVLVELDERRAALLTLLEARIAEHGAGAVLAL